MDSGAEAYHVPDWDDPGAHRDHFACLDSATLTFS